MAGVYSSHNRRRRRISMNRKAIIKYAGFGGNYSCENLSSVVPAETFKVQNSRGIEKTPSHKHHLSDMQYALNSGSQDKQQKHLVIKNSMLSFAPRKPYHPERIYFLQTLPLNHSSLPEKVKEVRKEIDTSIAFAPGMPLSSNFLLVRDQQLS